MKKFMYFIAGLAVFGGVFGYQWYNSEIDYALDTHNETVILIDIPKGATATDVGKLLQSRKLIRSTWLFRFYLKQYNMDEKLQAGRFVFQKNYNLPTLVETLVSGHAQELKVTLLEGWTIQQIAEHLEAVGLSSSDDFLACIKSCSFDFDFLPADYLEGYLYPDTYFVDPSSYSNEVFIHRLLSTFKKRLADDWTAIKKSHHTLEEIIIIASIVEREERNIKERPHVAGILWNRFEGNVGLGADATVLYGLGRTKGGLTQKDLESTSPYNTRKFRGLPPAPISNPSLSSIRATLYPMQTDDWYYLHSKEGTIHYAKTLDQHNINKQRHLR
jgi:UPF0755 protein